MPASPEGSTVLRSVGILSQHCTASQPRRFRRHFLHTAYHISRSTGSLLITAKPEVKQGHSRGRHVALRNTEHYRNRSNTAYYHNRSVATQNLKTVQ
jgi:hypothetical protein